LDFEGILGFFALAFFDFDGTLSGGFTPEAFLDFEGILGFLGAAFLDFEGILGLGAAFFFVMIKFFRLIMVLQICNLL